MAPFPDEVDVFTGPHWRMKQLVGLYCEKTVTASASYRSVAPYGLQSYMAEYPTTSYLRWQTLLCSLSKTNFSNNKDFRSFLQSLCATFTEFKMHEQIENEYIICLLQQRSNTVYNVHSDNKLSEMLSLFQRGLRNIKNECEQLNYAQQLKERLEDFTQDFLPHMKEEEEVRAQCNALATLPLGVTAPFQCLDMIEDVCALVFQPMLMEYFTYEELKDIKKTVMAQHCRQPGGDGVGDCRCQRADSGAEVLKDLSFWSQEGLHRAYKYSVHEKADNGEPQPRPASAGPALSLLLAPPLSYYPTPIHLLVQHRLAGPETRFSSSGSLPLTITTIIIITEFKQLMWVCNHKFEKSPEPPVSQLPPEVLLKVFQYLSPEDLCHCGQVCTSWAQLAKTGSLWRHLYPVRWARGEYCRGPPEEQQQEPDAEWVESREAEGRAYQEWDEDADIDESGKGNNAPVTPANAQLHTSTLRLGHYHSTFSDSHDEVITARLPCDDVITLLLVFGELSDAGVLFTEAAPADSPAISAVQREKKLLNGIIQNLLPAVGPSVKSIVLAYSSALSSKMVRQILSLCPNLTHLDLTQTDVTDSAFDSWASLGACVTLEHLDLSGCEKITDLTLKRLSLALGDPGGPKPRPTRGLDTPPAPPVSLRAQRGRQALVFRRRPHGPAHVWVLDPAQLADIEDAAEWRRRGGATESGGRGFSEPPAPPPANTCCCRRSRRRGLRTNSASYWQQYSSGEGEARCGHSSCCSGSSGQAALRTISPASGSGFRTKWAEEGENARPRSDCCRRLRLLSLSGCFQVTDLGLRCFHRLADLFNKGSHRKDLKGYLLRPRALSQRGGLPRLEHLNLSGCLFITESGLQELVSVCPVLNDEHFYYCDNINAHTHTHSHKPTTATILTLQQTHTLVLQCQYQQLSESSKCL
ncbi:hypothetical protein JZ751_018835 [Albula glossodonta]|uniref:F-box domain-containing protein n=1 Tax=Albula glossodonta TaxID=121402 RepID=A0A8T2MV66_9TELE|nr:hypothetical protein JZ751_018835 [Albula glossodonta]